MLNQQMFDSCCVRHVCHTLTTDPQTNPLRKQTAARPSLNFPKCPDCQSLKIKKDKKIQDYTHIDTHMLTLKSISPNIFSPHSSYMIYRCNIWGRWQAKLWKSIEYLMPENRICIKSQTGMQYCFKKNINTIMMKMF